MQSPRFQFRLRTLLAVVAGIAICCPIVRYFVPGSRVPIHHESVLENALVGLSENEILSTYGQPTFDKPLFRELGFGFASQDRRPDPKPPTRTLIFDRAEGGTLWVWLSNRGSGWVCFESCWFADGVQF